MEKTVLFAAVADQIALCTLARRGIAAEEAAGKVGLLQLVFVFAHDLGGHNLLFALSHGFQFGGCSAVQLKPRQTQKVNSSTQYFPPLHS